MASRTTAFPASNHKTASHNKSTNPRTRQVDHKKKFTAVPEMSPEARRAILLAREDSKCNNTNSRNKRNGNSTSSLRTQNDVDDCSDVDTNNNNSSNRNNINCGSNNRTSNGRGRRDIIRAGERHPKSQQSISNQNNANSKNNNNKSGSPSTRPPRIPYAGTSRSRSSISQNEPPFSMSDHNEIASHFGTNTTSNASVYTSNLSCGNNNNTHNNNGSTNTGINNNIHTTGDIDADDDNDSALPNDESFEEEEESIYNKDSFVLALDKALEKKDVSRLKGDITDTTQDSKPGTVRALNGGRLTNAQEVVVNVCYDDDKELVFHDDDEESIDTAKAISKIRVNIWMEYNSKFPPENNVLNDFDSLAETSNDRVKQEPETNRQRRPSVSTIASREKTFVSSSQRTQAIRKDGLPKKLSVDSVGSHKNATDNKSSGWSTTSFKRTPSNSRLRSVTSSPTPSLKGSGTSSRGQVKSVNSSYAKPSTPIRKKR